MVHNFVKIAGAIPHVAVGNCNYNTRQIINLIKQAEEKRGGNSLLPRALHYSIYLSRFI